MNLISHPKFRSMSNAALLIVSFGMGQGSIFLAQTWLIKSGELGLLAHFGTHFSFAILVLMIIDGGSVTALSRRVSIARAEGDIDREICASYWQASLFRMSVAAVIAFLCVIYALSTQSMFSRAYVLCSIPALFIWAFNASGIVDGLKLSGLSGITGILAYASSAVALLIAADGTAENAGILLGSALSGGYALTVLAQLTALQVIGHFPLYRKAAWPDILRTAREGGPILLSTLPGQLFFRFQIIVCHALLGEAATAVFLYGRQIAGAISQIIEFVRRAEFPLLVTNLRRSSTPVRTTFETQNVATWGAAAASVLLFAGGILGSEILEDHLAMAAGVVALFSVGVFSGSISLTLSQAGYALGRFASVAAATNFATVIGLATSAVFAWFLGLAGLALSEVVMHGMVALLLFYSMTRNVDPTAEPRPIT